MGETRTSEITANKRKWSDMERNNLFLRDLIAVCSNRFSSTHKRVLMLFYSIYFPFNIFNNRIFNASYLIWSQMILMIFDQVNTRSGIVVIQFIFYPNNYQATVFAVQHIVWHLL